MQLFIDKGTLIDTLKVLKKRAYILIRKVI